MTNIKVGDQVAYSAAWLRSTGSYTGELPQARGVVKVTLKETGGLKLALIQWDRPDIPDTVNVANLVKVVDGFLQEPA